MTEWLYVADRRNKDGVVTERMYETFSTTFSDFDVISVVGPTTVDEIFIGQRGFTKNNVRLYKIFQVPIGITEETEDEG